MKVKTDMSRFNHKPKLFSSLITNSNLDTTMLVFENEEEKQKVIKHLQNMPEGFLKYCIYPDNIAGINPETINTFMDNIIIDTDVIEVVTNITLTKE